jgi:dipeptidyl-peptidase 4
MTPRRATPLAVLGIALLAVAASAQQTDRARVLDEQLGRIFQANEYRLPRFGPARWLPDGTGYTVVERSGEKATASDIVRYDAATGARTILVAGAALVPAGKSEPLDIDDYDWSKDARHLLIFTNTRKVWRDNTRGDYWILDTQSKRLHQVGGSAPEATLMFAKFSPDGSKVAYVRANDIYVEPSTGGEVTRLTSDGSETTINGTSDWVYEEELGVRDCFRWSPDGARIAYWQFDTTGVGVFSLINNTDTLYPVIARIPYPKVGTPNSAVRIGVVDLKTRATKWMNTPGDPRDNYLANLEWRDPDTVVMEQLNRLQNRHDVLLGNARDGEVRRVFRDESKTWIERMDPVHWIDKGRAFLVFSERDGWRHVFRVARDGGEAALVTRFEADVIDSVGVDEAGGWLYFRASPQNATQRYLYRSRLDGSGLPERVTPNDQPGTHTYDAAPDARLSFHTYSSIDRLPVTDVVDLSDHRSVRALTDPSAVSARLAPVLKQPAEFFTIEIGDGVALDGWMLKPRDFDPSRRYPVIVYVYGEVAGQTVLDRWLGNQMLFHRALADAGYIVVSMDNRGTPAPKGAAWRHVVYGTVGELSSREQDAAIRALATRHAFIDRDRIAIWGWSGGGSNTLNAMFRYPDTYKVGVSVAPVPDQTLYDTIYQERYMGLPKDNEQGYKVGSPINFAQGLKGKLLIIHGTGDDNVHAQGTERLVNKLIELGKSFDLMMYPNRTHSISEGAGTSAHIYRLIARYFVEHLPLGTAATSSAR